MSIILGYNSFMGTDFYSQQPYPVGQYFDLTLQGQVFDEVIIDKTIDIYMNQKSEWSINTYLLAKFQNNIEAGNVSLGGLEITHWKIRRRKITNLNFQELAIVPMGQDDNFYYLDKAPQSHVVYEYEVIPMSGDIEGEAFTTQIECKFDYWWITDGNESFPLWANIEVSDISTNIQRHIYDGFDQFPIVSYGTQKYQSGSITAYILDGNLETSKTYRDNLIAFLNNQKQKLLKNPEGDIWVVDTHTVNRKPHTELEVDLSSVSFEWTEIDKLNE